MSSALHTPASPSMNVMIVRPAVFVGALLLCSAAHAETTPTPLFSPAASARAVFRPASFIATYRSGNFNTMTITGRFFLLYSLLDLSPAATLGFSDAGSATIAVFTSNNNGNSIIPLLPSLLTSNGNFFYTVTVNKRTGVARAVCRAVHGSNPSFSFTATSDNPPTAGTFSLIFTVAKPGSLPLTATRAPQPTLQGLPNLTLQIGSAFFPATKIKRNRAVFP